VALFWATLVLSFSLWLLSYFITFGVEQGKLELQQMILLFAEFAPLVYVLLFALRGIFFVPATAMIILGGAIFNPLQAFVLSLIGLILSVMILFSLARFIGRDLVKKRENKQFRNIDEALAKRGFFATLIMIVIPFIPVDLVALVAGVTAISTADFFIGLLLGSLAMVLPIIFLTNSLGSPLGIALTIVSYLLVVLTTWWAYKHPHFEKLFGIERKRK
jgi:uncharacterized membrane protein YdjX (TVP38/TMEM64 family)